MEGSKCTGSTGCTCNDLALTLPFHEYAHTSSRCSIIGGYVYRGNHIPGLQGTYFFADFCSDEIWSLEYVGGVVNNFLDRTQELTPPIGFINSIASFGEDGAGELYIVDLGGEIYKIIRACEPPQNVCTSEVNSGGTSSIMEWAGSTSLEANDFVLKAREAASNQMGLFFYGGSTIDVPFGNGHLCVGSMPVGVKRLVPPVMVGFLGNASRSVDYGQPPMNSGPGRIQVGSTWYFQFWFRDPAAGGARFNTSDGLQVVFCH
jgi:hypothetical protein